MVTNHATPDPGMVRAASRLPHDGALTPCRQARDSGATVRAVAPGEGVAVAGLWRELWDAHEGWGGYRASQDPRVYEALARRLDAEARERAGQLCRGRHIHLVAATSLHGEPCGQVEGWVVHLGRDPATPFTCEVRSLIVTERVRARGAGRALLDALLQAARGLSGGAPCVLSAEVLEGNPARAFYERLGYAPVGHVARVDAEPGASRTTDPDFPQARIALARDALPVVCLDGVLAARRRAAGDVRFDPPRNLDLNRLDAMAARLGSGASTAPGNVTTLLSVDGHGRVHGGAFFATQALEPPFIPTRRALIGGFAVTPGCAALPVVTSLVALACRLALAQGAPHVEIADLSAPGSELHAAAMSVGAVPWSRIMTKLA